MYLDNHHNRQINHHERPPIIEEEKPLTSNCNSVTKIVTSDMEKKPKEDWRLDDSIVNNSKKNADGADVSLNESESYTVIIREHESKHHGHSHSHGLFRKCFSVLKTITGVSCQSEQLQR